MYCRKYSFIVLFTFFNFLLYSQEKVEKILRIEDGTIILTVNLQWNAIERYNVAKSFDIDSLAIESAYKGASEIVSGKTKWKVKKVNNSLELSKKMESTPIGKINSNDVLIADDSWLDIKVGNPPIKNKTGINKLKNDKIFSYHNDIARFFLPSFKNARKVYLSGSFNTWSTLQTPMEKSDSGWVVKLKLKPGKYTYKYIVDGKWHEDPNNYIREVDNRIGYNSVIFCTNYAFTLKGRLNAKKVILAGSFNGWGFDEYQMKKDKNGWTLPIFLADGTHAYKFIVDGEWITDPENKDIRSDAVGNLNSFIGFGESYLFKLNGYTSARKVIVTGSFNNWSQSELVMNKTQDGWQLPYIIAPGTYEYKFIVDGRWITDPGNTQTTGTGRYMNSILTFKPNHTFSLDGYSKAQTVIVTGTFNGWSRDSYRMFKKNGKWELPIYLSPGKYLYKFIVDGKWIMDPDNKLWEENEYGTGNSILWVEE